MRTLLKLSAAVIILFLFQTCDDLLESGREIKGSGNVIRIEQSIGEISNFQFSNALEVFIVKGSQPSVALLIDDNFEEFLIMEEHSDYLEIGLDPENSYRDYTFRADIIVPELEEITGSGAILADISGFESFGKLTIELSGASALKGDLIAAILDLSLSGASSVNLEGECNRLDINASGASSLQMKDFEAEEVEINLTGASIATIYSNGSISADLSGASILNYLGNAEIVSLRSSGASLVNHISDP